MTIKRLLCAILCSSMLLTAVACAEKKDNDTADETSAESEVETEAETGRAAVKDSVPELDYDGATFTIATQSYDKSDVYIESLTGEIVEDAVYNRNSNVSERLNIKLDVYCDLEYYDLSTVLVNSINAGDDAYQLVMQQTIEAGTETIDGLYSNWANVDYVDLSQPWYSQDSVSELTIDGKLFSLVSDMALSTYNATYCMLYDKVEAENYNLGDIYDIVNNGQWTIDKLTELVKDVYDDTNGNGQNDREDFHGFTSKDMSQSTAYLYSFDIDILEIDDEDGTCELVFNSEKTNDAVDKIRKLYWNTQGSCVTHDWGGGCDDFVAGRCVFANYTFVSIDENVKNLSHDYGIIPLPKWDEEQTGYYTMVDGSASVLLIPKTVQDTAMTGAVVECMSSYAYKNVVPAYYDVALKVKGTRDEESVAILDMIFEGRVVDFAYMYDGWKGFALKFNDLCYEDCTTKFESFYRSNQKSIGKYYQKVLDYFINAD